MAAKQETGRHKTWIRDFDFLIVMIGHGIGFGNVWRFPYVCYRNGGGAFLIPYAIAVLLLGIPLTLLEGCVGQFTSRGVIHAWRIVPLFSGLGYMLTVFSFVGKTAYSLLFAWVLYYLFSSMTSILPWSHCNNPWNTPQCRESVAWNGSHSTNSPLVPENSTALTSNQSLVTMDPASEFWERKVLSVSEGINHPGTVKWDIALCLLLAWLLIYFCVWKGIRLTAKVSYVTSTIPYLLLIVLLVRGVTLEGSAEGLKFYLQPKWDRLAKGQVWLDACIQVIYSYTLGGTIHTALGSCNKFHHNILKHYCIFSLINSATSFLCGFVIFSVLGFMANRQGVSVDNVAESGPGLAFIVYPEALAQLPAPYVWSILFFLMLAFVGIDSEFAGVKGFIISFSDLFSPRFIRTPYKEALSGLCCVTWFLLTLSMVTEGGIYVEQILEWYVGGRVRMVVLFLETFVISYCYGVNRFQKNVQFMLGYSPRKLRQEISSGKAEILFASPESILRRKWLSVLRTQYRDKICLHAYDEVHCVSEWGLDFRPDYRDIRQLCSLLDAPTLALTATTTSAIQKDVYDVLCLGEDARVVAKLPDRPNVFIHLLPGKEHFFEEVGWLIEQLKVNGINTPKTLVYCSTIHRCQTDFNTILEELGDRCYLDSDIKVENRLVEMFHSATADDTKTRIQTEFSSTGSKIRILMATVAFGMGIDIPDVKIVINWGLPGSILQYWQESGRCARNGQPGLSVCYPFPRSVSNCKDKSLVSLKSTYCCLRKSVLETFMLDGMEREPLDHLLGDISMCQGSCQMECACRYCCCCTNCMAKCTCKAKITDVICRFL